MYTTISFSSSVGAFVLRQVAHARGSIKSYCTKMNLDFYHAPFKSEYHEQAGCFFFLSVSLFAVYLFLPSILCSGNKAVLIFLLCIVNVVSQQYLHKAIQRTLILLVVFSIQEETKSALQYRILACIAKSLTAT